MQVRNLGRRLRRSGLCIGLGGLGVATLLTLAALIPRQWQINPSQDCRYTVYVSGGIMHTNLILPRQTDVYDWSQFLPDPPDLQPLPYLQVGWGDRIFYLETPSWDKIDTLSALRSLVYWRNQTALFVLHHADVSRNPDETLKCVRLSQADYLALITFVRQTFKTTPANQPILLKTNPDRQGKFYAAQGYYSALRTCNSWTAEALRAANVNTPLWAGLAPPVLHHLRNGCTCNN